MLKVHSVLLVSHLLFLLSTSAVSGQQHLIFDRELGDVQGLRKCIGSNPCERFFYSKSIYQRNIGIKLNEIKKQHRAWKDPEYGETKLNEYKINDISVLNITWDRIDTFDHHSVIYLAGENKIIEGYCLIEDQFDIHDFPTHPFVMGVKALPQNSHYLPNKLINPAPAKLTLRVYEQSHPDHIERYAVLSYFRTDFNAVHEFLVLDAYYPKSLESSFEQQIADGLNKIMRSHEPYASIP
jgi:hypothetical protein